MNDSRHPDRHFMVGVIVLALGVILLLDQLGFSEITKFWPLILIYFGAKKLSSSQDMNGRFWGGFLTLLGIAFQLQELGFSHIRFETIWPVFLICVGVLLVLRRYESRAGSFPPPPQVPPVPPIPGPPGSTPPTSETPMGSEAPAGSAAQTQSPPPFAATASQAPPQPPPYTQVPPSQPPPGVQSNFGANPNCAPPPWQNDPRWERFQRRMNRFNERMNDKWQQQQPHTNWQFNSNANWQESSQPRIDEVNVFWGGRRRIVSKNFMGGDIVAIFGGFDIDLTQADFQGDQVVIEVVSIFGGGDIRVPPNWEVMIDSVGIFGGTGDRTIHPSQQNPVPSAPVAAPKRLIIKGVSIFGGLTVKN